MRIIQKALTFDDVLLVPAYSNILPRDVTLKTKLTRDIDLNIPVLAAAMDTVSEARMAIALAQEGGIAIIHKNLSVEQQAAEVAKAKRYEAGVVKDPITINSRMTVRDVLGLTRQHKISGLPVVDGGKVVGIVTNRDLRFETRYDEPVSRIMTPKERLVTVKEGATREEILKLLHQHRIEKVLVVNDKFQLRGLITFKDGKAASAQMNWGELEAPTLIKGVVWTATGTDNTLNVLNGMLVEDINEFIGKKCDEVKSDWAGQ